MVQVVEQLGECSINAARYWIVPGRPTIDDPRGRPGQVTTQIASRYPPKLVSGDTNRDSDPVRSFIAWSDPRGGWGVEAQRDQSDVTRVWFSFLNLSHDTHLTLPVLPTLPSSPQAGTVGAINDLADVIYATFGTGVFAFDGSVFGALLDTLPAAATDSINIRLNGTVYLIFATTGGWTYTSNGTVFTDITDDALFLARFDDKLWTIDNTGQVRSFSDVTATAVTGPQLPLPDGSVKKWVKGRDADGNQILMASTDVGLWALDIGNNKFTAVEPEFPQTDNTGQAVRWRDAVYFSAGTGVFKFNQGSRTAVVQPMGPDLDHGLDIRFQGPISYMAASHNFLIIAIDTDAGAGIDAASTILGWNGIGWQLLAGPPNGDSRGDISPFHVSSAHGEYRLWYANGLGASSGVEFIPLQESIINPDNVVTAPSYVSGGAFGEHILPEFDAFQSEVEKLALAIRVEVEEIGASALGSVVVDFRTNFASSFTTLGTITAAGETTFTFPDNGTNPDIGTLFRWIQIRIVMTRGATTTSTPDVRSITLEYRKKLIEKLAFRVQLDLTKDSPDGKTPQEQLAGLRTARNVSEKIEFTFRNDDTAGNPRNYYVDIIEASSQEDTGLDEAGIVTLVLREP